MPGFPPGFLSLTANNMETSSGTVFVGNEYATFVALDSTAEGKLLWENDEGLPEVACPVAFGTILVVPTSYGLVTCWDTATGKTLWEHEFDDGFYASPVVAAGRPLSRFLTWGVDQAVKFRR